MAGKKQDGPPMAAPKWLKNFGQEAVQVAEPAPVSVPSPKGELADNDRPTESHLDGAATESLLHEALALPAAATPFPWQLRLLERFLQGDLPRSLDIPTGLGKTAVMAIWLVARALGAALPRRLVYVVDRRAVVDQATEVAEGLRGWVARTPSVAKALLLRPGASLPISTLRGQFADNREWLSDPSATGIVVGTVDMIGSRLLFEGYGVSRKMRPYHAGLLGADSLLVLDEAHLVPPFEALIETICAGGDLAPSEPPLRDLIPPLRLLSLSATGKATRATFQLTSGDEAHAVVRKRLDASKSTFVRKSIDPEQIKLHEALAVEAWTLSEMGSKPMRCIIFCNSREGAQGVQAELEAKATKARVPIDCDLFVGGRRVHERDEASKWLRQRGFLAGSVVDPDVATFLVATSAGEVGVDLDADHMVSDVVAWERMVQRLGRVNRRGEREAQVVVVPSLPSKKEQQALDRDAEDRNAQERAIVARIDMMTASERALQQLPRRGNALDASPGALSSLRRRAQNDAELATLLASATTRPPLHPALSRALVESWSMTSLEQHTGRPEVDPWIRGWVDHEPQTTIVWRTKLPVSHDGAALKAKVVEAFFEAAAPHLLEQLETETYHALDWLCTRLAAVPEKPKSNEFAADEKPSVGALTRDQVVAFLHSRDGAITSLRGSLLEEHRRGPKAAREQLERDLRDATLIVDARLGGLLAGLINDESDAPVVDVGEARTDLPFRVRSAGIDEQRSKEWFEELRVATDSTEEGEPQRWLVVERPRLRSANTEEGRSTSRAQTLTDHQSWAEIEATSIASRLGLPSPYDKVLALAARLHDEGKQAPMWQRAFKAPRDAVYAKTVSRPNIALLDGYRHELGSLPYAMKDARVNELEPELRDLCLHLIAAHHGFARPVIRTSGCEDAPPSALVERAQQIAIRFSELEQRWGPWGLAWWESLLRAADQEASRKNDEAGENTHG